MKKKMRRKKSLLLIAILILGCSQFKKNENLKIENEIIGLKTNNDKKKYLEKILIDDQKVRGNESQEIILKYGYGSKEYLDYNRKQKKTDKLNLLKIEKYLSTYGYPNKELGKKAVTTPWIVIHHSQDYKTRERNFDKVYKAYLNEDIDYNAMSLYLGRMYLIKNGKSLNMKSPFKPEDEINELIKELNLERKKANAQHRI